MLFHCRKIFWLRILYLTFYNNSTTCIYSLAISTTRNLSMKSKPQKKPPSNKYLVLSTDSSTGGFPLYYTLYYRKANTPALDYTRWYIANFSRTRNKRGFTCTALLRKQLFCPGPLSRPFVLVKLAFWSTCCCCCCRSCKSWPWRCWRWCCCK